MNLLELLTFNNISTIFWLGTIVYVVFTIIKTKKSVEALISNNVKTFFRNLALASTVAEVLGLIIVAIERDMPSGSAIPRFLIPGFFEIGSTLLFGAVVTSTIAAIYSDGKFEFAKEWSKALGGLVMATFTFFIGVACTKTISLLYYESIGAITVDVILNNIVSFEIPFAVKSTGGGEGAELSALILIYATPGFNIMQILFFGIDLFRIYILGGDAFKILKISEEDLDELIPTPDEDMIKGKKKKKKKKKEEEDEEEEDNDDDAIEEDDEVDAVSDELDDMLGED